MKIKKGDKVQVITGAYKDTVGEVTAVFPKENRIIVEGVNIVKKHMKPTQQNPDGGIMEKEAKIHISNVMLYDEKAKKALPLLHLQAASLLQGIQRLSYLLS